MNIPTGVVVKSIALLGGISAYLQTMPGPLDLTLIDKAQRMGLDTILVVAVIVLWRKLQEKDAILMVNYKTMADALAANNLVTTKMNDTLERIDTAVEKMSSVRSVLSGS